jgi:hypothetical protein
MATDAQVQKASRVLDEEIAALRGQVALAKRRHPKQPTANDATSGLAQASQEQPLAGALPEAEPLQHESASAGQDDVDQRTSVEYLAAQGQRLEQVQDWILSDRAMLPLIAKAVGVDERTFVRRSFWLNVVLSTIFLIAGWLLSTFASPVDLGRFLGR